MVRPEKTNTFLKSVFLNHVVYIIIPNTPAIACINLSFPINSGANPNFSV